MNSKHKDMKLNTTLQNFMYTMLKDNNAIAAKTSLDIMVVLYTKHVWRDAKTVNVIATACFSKVTKIMVAALKFFLGKDDDGHKDSDSDDSDDEKNPHKIVSEMSLANRVNKKSKKRQKLLERTKSVTKKSKQKNKAPDFNFSAIHLLHDPQGLAEKLFKLLDKLRERFEVKLMVMNFLSRLIGIHQLFIFNFYPLIQRFLQPHQKEVTKILVYAAQSAHELVPPDVLEPVLKTIANNFITERNSSEGMAVGLNAARELCARCPLVMTEDLLQDLSMYGTMKDKNVSMAAKSIIQFYRVTNPQMLRRKDRGRPTEETKNMKPLEYGQLDSKNYVPGAEVLAEKKDGGESEHSDDDGEWVDADDDIEEDSDENESGDGDSDVEDEDDDAVELEERPTKKLKTTDSEKLPIDFKLGNTEVATMISADRILTDEDFKAIRKAQLIKQIRASNPKKKEQIDSDVDSDDLEDAFEKKEIVSLKEIERLYKKSRPTKESRLASVQAGREGREKFGSRKEKKSPHASTNDREKRKHKPYAMVKHKVIAKKKRSFQDKQQALRQSLIKRMKAN
ncbi:Protein SDA1 -like protein [Halotydeus destructor]|nr:Protein SDA1 -like protein [Halotydeus destructor]